MKRFFDPSKEVLTPVQLVCSITKRPYDDLILPERAIILFSQGDLGRILAHIEHSRMDAWYPFRTIYKTKGKGTIFTKSVIGGPNIAAIVEEFSCFGVKEFIMWGYCGGINRNLKFGDVILTRGAIREDGVSYHYLEDSEREIVYSSWVDKWQGPAYEAGFLDGIVWSSDAIYRETEKKIIKYSKEGILAVEMEVSSFYSVCSYRGLKGIAFLVVSDIFTEEKWIPGFHEERFKKGIKKIMEFILKKGIV
ncbi:MAG: nucleoside phosphorylase [Syntrophorhabdaceae bacterium]|nr:nucleoside phosphorylase [Syntrophorhabdaceae bacterium]